MGQRVAGRIGNWELGAQRRLAVESTNKTIVSLSLLALLSLPLLC